VSALTSDYGFVIDYCVHISFILVSLSGDPMLPMKCSLKFT